MAIFKNENKFSLKNKFSAGEYYIGDLSYVITDRWKEVCGQILGSFELKDGTKLFMDWTSYGDGTYYDNSGNSYSVDSGTLGIIAVKDIATEELKPITGGNIHRFADDFEVTATDGYFVFGDVIINTQDQEEDDYDGYDYDGEVE